MWRTAAAPAGWRSVRWSIGSATSRRISSPIGGGAVGDQPRRRRIAVDGHQRAVLGPVGERLAVGRRRARTGPSCTATVGAAPSAVAEHRQPLVGGIVAAARRARRVVVLGEPDDVLRAAPVVGPVAVGVGDDDRRRRAGGGRSARRRRASRCSGPARGRRAARRRRRRRGRRRCRRRARRRPWPGSRPRVVDAAPARRAGPAAPTRGSDTDCSSTIGTSGRLTTGSPYGTAVPEARDVAGEEVVRRSPGAACGSGRRRRRRSPRSCRRRAGGRSGRSIAGSTVPAWKRSSRAYSEVHRRGAAERQQVAGDERPVGQPGQRRVDGVAPAEGAELLARAAAARGPPVASASRAAAASSQAAGGSWSRSMAGSTRRCPVSDGRLATASSADRGQPPADATTTRAGEAQRRRGRRRARRRRGPGRASAPARRGCSSAGPARRPTSPSPSSRSISGDGSSIGCTPTPSTTPVTTRATAKRRCRQRVTHEAGEADEQEDEAGGDQRGRTPCSRGRPSSSRRTRRGRRSASSRGRATPRSTST